MIAPVLMRSAVVSAACSVWVVEALRLIAEKENLSVSALLADVSREFVTARGYSPKEIEKLLVLGVSSDDCAE